MSELEEELAAINSLRLGPHLANRDFGLYQRRHVIETELGELQVSGKLKAIEARDTAAFYRSVPVTGTMARTEARDTAAISGTVT